MTLTKRDIEGLEKLLEQSDEYTSVIFDWVAPLDQRHLLGHLYDFKSKIEAQIAALKKEEADTEYWTFERDGEIYDADFETRDAAQADADETFAEQCCEDSPRNGETFEEDITLIRFKYDDDGERVILERIDTTVEYEHYHGDYAEHFRQSDYI